MPVNMQEGNMPHIYWIDFKGDGVYTECAVMKKDGFGNVYYFPLKALDDIDKRRLARILTNRNATHFELWDLMSNITLNNGVNALSYFHQLVQVVTPSGRVMKPQEGVVGTNSGTIDTRGADYRKEMEESAGYAARAAAEAAATAAANAVRSNSAQQHDAQQAQPQQVNEDAAPPAAPKKKRASKKKAASKAAE